MQHSVNSLQYLLMATNLEGFKVEVDKFMQDLGYQCLLVTTDIFLPSIPEGVCLFKSLAWEHRQKDAVEVCVLLEVAGWSPCEQNDGADGPLV